MFKFTRCLIAADHGGLDLKQRLIPFLQQQDLEVVDCGPDAYDGEDDFPDYAALLSEKLLALDDQSFGVLICGSGLGMSIAANKINGIRAALCTDTTMARLARQHSNANVVCLGARIIGEVCAQDIVTHFLQAVFEGGRHQRRLDLIKNLEGQ